MRLPHVPAMAKALYEGAGSTISAATRHAIEYAKGVGNYARANKEKALVAMSAPVALSGAYAMAIADRPAVVREAKELGGEAAKYWEGIKDSVMAKAYAAECAEVATQQKCGEAPRFFWVANNMFGGGDNETAVVDFMDDLGIGMKAFAETGGKIIELKYYQMPRQLGANFVIPNEMRTVSQLDVFAVDRDGNQSEIKTIYTVDGLFVPNKPKRSTVAPRVDWVSNRRIAYSDDLPVGVEAYAEADGRTIKLKTELGVSGGFYVRVPSDLLALPEFSIVARDRDGNESRESFYIADGVVVRGRPATSTVAPRFKNVINDLITFEDDVAPEMRAYFESGNGNTVLKPYIYENDDAVFRLPEGVKDVPEFRVYARDRDGNASESTTIYVVDGIPTAKKPAASTVAPTVFSVNGTRIVYTDDMIAGLEARAEVGDRVIPLKADVRFDTWAYVDIAPELLDVPQFDVVAKDRDGNKRRITFYVYDGVPSTMPPCEPEAYEF